MTEPAAGPRRPRSPLSVGWGAACLRGATAFGALAGLALVAALAVHALGIRGLSLGEAIRAGGLYLAAFHRVPIRMTAGDSGVGALLGAPTGPADLHAELAVAPLAATALAAWLLWRAGRATASSVGGTPLERALHGAKVAPVYALGVLLVSLVAHVGVSRVDLVTSGVLDARPAPLWSLLLPFALALVAGAAGGWWSSSDQPESRRLRGILAGGWTMLLAALGLAYAGLVVVGVVRPDGVEAVLTPTTGVYYQAVFREPDVGAVVLAHHLALAPNEAAWTLVPAMGGCTGVFRASDVPDPFLCYRRFPLETAFGVPPVSDWLQPGVWMRFGRAPLAYLLFLIAPAAAALLGGWRAATSSRAASGSVRRAAVVGAGAGAVFAALLAVVSWAASISGWASLRVGLVTDEGAARVGPDLRAAVLLGLAWGVIGGALGAAATTWGGLRRSTAPPPPAR